MPKHAINEAQEAINELSTILDMIRWCVSQFNQHDLSYGHGTENSWDESFNLVLSSLHLPPDADKNIMMSRITTSERTRLVSQIQRRVHERIPVPYLVNEAWFGGLNFYVDERVIIPRSPIAELIDAGFQPWLEPSGINSVLDLCTGSGCIAITCAMVLEDAQIDAVDISEDALAVAKINQDRYGLEDYVHLIKSDLFDGLQGKTYDLILSNPPYVSEEEVANLPIEYTHEPGLALEAGIDGLDCVRRILRDAPKHLNPGGVLIVEVGYAQDILEFTYPDIPFTWLQFEQGGEGVFLLTAEELASHPVE